MKKNRMMRLASVLLVCVLLTTSVISGTFAKYITTAESTDSARVAKWGITMGLEENVSGNAMQTFVDTYDATAAVKTVDSDDDADVVAPGTSGSVKYVVDGAPETAYQVTFAGSTTADIYLEMGKYTYKADDADNITYVGMDVESMSKEYYPLDWQVTIETSNGTFETGSEWAAGIPRVFSTLSAAMTALSNAKVDFAANQECDIVVTVAWEWDFDAADGSITENTYVSNDVYDTILGDLAANNPDLKTNAIPHLNVNYTLKMTATQVD